MRKQAVCCIISLSFLLHLKNGVEIEYLSRLNTEKLMGNLIR
jgi:hypothetical protein